MKTHCIFFPISSSSNYCYYYDCYYRYYCYYYYFARDCGVAYPTVERSLRIFPCSVLLFQERAPSRKISDKFPDVVELSE